jgi:calcium-dependent protein kinase
LSQSYTNKCDVWSIGVITYILLCGFPPFQGGNDYEIIMEVEAARVSFSSPEWDDISGAAKDFVTYLLQKDPIRRPTAKEALEHAWIADNTTPTIPAIPGRAPMGRRASSELRLEGEKRNAFQKFLAEIKFKKTLGTIAELLTPSEASYLGAIFQKVDNDNQEIDAVEIDHAVETGNFSSSLKDKLMELKEQLALRGNMDVRQFLAASEKKAAMKRQESEYRHDSLGA